jgi:CRISPR-associated protein Cmr6
MNYPVTRRLSQLLTRLPDSVDHPGLLLDRYVAYPTTGFDVFDQENGQQPHIQEVIRLTNRWLPGGARVHEASTILEGWDRFTEALPGKKAPWKQSTRWRLALHLSRASGLENASCCLHPLYGFAYLPGTGLKGLAHAYAHALCESATGDEQMQLDRDMKRLFGSTRQSGTVSFLDAWPSHWPELEMDIVNNHHKDYYGYRGKDLVTNQEYPPGDWEAPKPTYFLAVKPATTFRFALVGQDPEVPQTDVDRMKDWLVAALQDLGAGAKTAAGYGYFDEATDLVSVPEGT